MSNSKRILHRKHKNTVLEKRRQDINAANKILSLTKTLLCIVGDIGAAGVRSFFPHPYYHTFCEHRKRSVDTTLLRLQKSGLIVCKSAGEKFFTLTKKGEHEFEKIKNSLHIFSAKEKQWDGKWRVLIFDIPKQHNKYRHFLRGELIEYGFLPLQKSVWISPFRVSEELKIIIEEHSMDKWIKLMIVDPLFDDTEWKNKWNL